MDPRFTPASSEVQQRKHDTQVLTSGGAAARQEGAYVGEWQLKAYGGVYLDYTWPLNYFEQQHCLLSQEACTLATTPKKVGIGGCKLPAEDDRVLAAFKTDVVSKELDNCRGCGPPSTFLCGSLAVNSSGTGPRKKQLEERKPG